MRILITGAAGMLGRRLLDAFGNGFETAAIPRSELDVTDFAAVRRTVAAFRPDWILHAAAYTKVDRAESESDLAYRINALGCRNVAVAAFENGARLVSFSTDYVFPGSSSVPLREWDLTSPINSYGRSKWAGELFIRDLCPEHVIVRTSWLFGAQGPNFVDRMIELSRTREEIRVVNDQFGSPTYTADLAEVTRTLVQRNVRGIYHVTNQGSCSWYEFAGEILKRTGWKGRLCPIPSEEFPTAAARPRYSVLDNYHLRMDGIPMARPWQEALKDYLAGHHG